MRPSTARYAHASLLALTPVLLISALVLAVVSTVIAFARVDLSVRVAYFALSATFCWCAVGALRDMRSLIAGALLHADLVLAFALAGRDLGREPTLAEALHRLADLHDEARS